MLNGTTKDTWIKDADIKGCFDNISHEYILLAIGQIPGRELILQWLKAGYVIDVMFHPTESGTPQGGTISPLLANIALDGLDNLLSQYKKVKTYQTTRNQTGKVEKVKIKSEKYGFIRYADDFIVTAKNKEDIEAIIPVIEGFLRERGLTRSSRQNPHHPCRERHQFLGFSYPSVQREDIHLTPKGKSPMPYYERLGHGSKRTNMSPLKP